MAKKTDKNMYSVMQNTPPPRVTKDGTMWYSTPKVHKVSKFFHHKTGTHLISSLFSGTTWVSWHQKGKTILDFTEARDDRVTVASAGPYANHLHLAPDR